MAKFGANSADVWGKVRSQFSLGKSGPGSARYLAIWFRRIDKRWWHRSTSKAGLCGELNSARLLGTTLLPGFGPKLSTPRSTLSVETPELLPGAHPRHADRMGAGKVGGVASTPHCSVSVPERGPRSVSERRPKFSRSLAEVPVELAQIWPIPGRVCRNWAACGRSRPTAGPI